MPDITARVVADSVGERSPRLLSLQTRAPKFIHQESLRHRRIYLADVLSIDPDFSFSVSSSRAIPFGRMLDEASDPLLMAKPVKWGAEQKGMSPGDELDDVDHCIDWYQVVQGLGFLNLIVNTEHVMITKRECAERLWELGGIMAARIAATNVSWTGVHKSIANRQIETYVHANVLMTGTEPGWMNFFGLRLDKAADPTLRALAERCWVCWCESAPRRLEPGQWHLPYADDEETFDAVCLARDGIGDWTDTLLKVSTARCARLSYLSFETQRRSTIDEDLGLYARLVGSAPIHASPAEHQATPDTIHGWSGVGNYLMPDDPPLPMFTNEHQAGNLGPGWRQHRKMLAGEEVAPLPLALRMVEQYRREQ